MDLKALISILPDKPGVYQYYDDQGVIIYVGKAKNLKKRVSSYFLKNVDNGKTRILVSKIKDIKHIVVETEEDALLLENNLIKKYQPKYNILLKDDKTYPWICIKKEHFPRVFSTRNAKRDGSIYFGPYTSSGMVRTLVELIHELFKLRTCSLDLAPSKIAKGNYEVCLQYHIGNCIGPCIGKIDDREYRKQIDQIKHILKGNLKMVSDYLKEEMMRLATDLKFEEAEQIKKRLIALDNYRSKSTIVSSSITNLDVYSFDEDEKYGYVNFMKVVDGAIIQTLTLEMRKRLDESKEQLLAMGIAEIRQRIFSGSREIILPFMIDEEFANVKMHIPQIGDKRKLLDLSQRNVKYYKLDKAKQATLRNPETKVDRLMASMKSELNLKNAPLHIECFDNSNIQGAFPVAACVVFKKGKPSKKDYRHFNIKTVEGPDDFASMEEVVYRRYKRLSEEGSPLPQLVVIDGGKGQLGSAVKILRELDLMGKIEVIGLAKRMEEVFIPGDPVPIFLDRNSETLRIIQHLRDEAHRFGITFHRNKRSGAFIVSELDQISGVGEKSKEVLLKHFKSIDVIKSQSVEQLAEFVGLNRAKLVYAHFHESEGK